MPRDGSGAGDNAIEAGETKVHGAGDDESTVDRSNKAAPLPDHEAGDALEGMNASGGGVKPEGSGEGPKETTGDKEAEKDK